MYNAKDVMSECSLSIMHGIRINESETGILLNK